MSKIRVKTHLEDDNYAFRPDFDYVEITDRHGDRYRITVNVGGVGLKVHKQGEGMEGIQIAPEISNVVRVL
jgi:hypothetical protein